MKKDPGIKYPNAANLFRFCRRVLDHKYGGIRVIDQDVGQILGFDPADCSHWKKGKKNIRSIQAVRNIAKHLGIDEKLVVDVATGDLDEIEAYHEYNGYGTSLLDSKFLESAKKEFYRKFASTWSKEKEQEFKIRFQTDTLKIDEIAREIHGRLNFKEAPLYLPEIVSSYPDIILRQADMQFPGDAQDLVTVEVKDRKVHITYPAGAEMRPYLRYRIAKAMAHYFLPQRSSGGLKEYEDHIFDIESNIFAAKLLAPTDLIRSEMKRLDISKDIVTQLSEIFWVSKAFINRRLRDILQEG